MKTAVGLWIDHRKAVIVVITDSGEETKLIVSKVERQLRRSGDSPLKGAYPPQAKLPITVPQEIPPPFCRRFLAFWRDMQVDEHPSYQLRTNAMLRIRAEIRRRLLPPFRSPEAVPG